jgi:hypothetical protein
VSPVRYSEGVHHEDIGKACQLLGEIRVVLLLFGMKPKVFQQTYFPRPHGSNG